MRLPTALRLNDGEIIALTGAGETTTLFRLAEHIVAAGGRVITTSLVPLAVRHVHSAPQHFSAFDVNRARVEAALSKQAHVLITGPVDRTLGRAAPVTEGLIEELHQIPDLTAILVKADEAEQHPFKAPLQQEPSVPTVAALVVHLAGLLALGQPLEEAAVQHAERAAELSGAALGARLTPEIMAAVIAHPQGGLKNAPPGSRKVIFLNQAETPEALTAARWMAGYLLRHSDVEAVLIGSARQTNAVLEVQARTAAVVLAAGRSTRMGRSKQLLPWGDSLIISEVVLSLLATSATSVIVVTGADREAVESALAQLSASGRVRCVFNPDFAESEMARSLQVGLRALPADCAAALVALADQPRLEPRVAEAVLQCWRETLAPVVAPYYQGQRGHPLLFDRTVWPRLMALPADANPRQALGDIPIQPVEVETDAILQDLDTPEAYAEARRFAARRE